MSDDLRNRVARAINEAHQLHGRSFYSMADAALAEMGGVHKGPDWEGFGRDLLQDWPVGDVEGSELFEAALRNGLLREIPGGYDPEQHIDAEGVCPETGDPWYEYAFGVAIEPAPVSEMDG